MAENTQELLQHHWAMDSLASVVLANRLEMSGQEHVIEAAVEHLDPAMVEKRDENTRILGRAFRGLGKMVFAVGGCSADENIDNTPVYELIEELNEEFAYLSTDPDSGVIFGTRLNGGKPRTHLKWRGLALSTYSSERAAFFDHHQKAFDRGILTITEVVNGPQLTSIAPYLSGYWLGMRDMLSTNLRDVSSLIQKPVAAKNGPTGGVDDVKNAVMTIRGNTALNDGSGVELGNIGRSARSEFGVDPGILPVGSGNQNVAIIARGYELHDKMTREEREEAAFEHLGSLCLLGEEVGAAVLLDGSHKVPHMLLIDASDETRFIVAQRKINEGIKNGRVAAAHMLRGGVYEVGAARGRTDKDFLIKTPADKESVKTVFRETAETILLEQNA